MLLLLLLMVVLLLLVAVGALSSTVDEAKEEAAIAPAAAAAAEECGDQVDVKASPATKAELDIAFDADGAGVTAANAAVVPIVPAATPVVAAL